jgi:hypothetical protein
MRGFWLPWQQACFFRLMPGIRRNRRCGFLELDLSGFPTTRPSDRRQAGRG